MNVSHAPGRKLPRCGRSILFLIIGLLLFSLSMSLVALVSAVGGGSVTSSIPATITRSSGLVSAGFGLLWAITSLWAVARSKAKPPEAPPPVGKAPAAYRRGGTRA
jgi:TRAP-type C4-dicarboxylate transport system permease small subunit